MVIPSAVVSFELSVELCRFLYSCVAFWGVTVLKVLAVLNTRVLAMDVGVVYSIIGGVVVVYIVALLLYIVRLVRGPTIPDRVLALDALSYDLSVLIALIALLLRRPIVSSGLIALTLWIYALDIYVSKYMEAREMGG